ncbi:hypothetical protein PspLS_08464 [Pyricularia sp. CBS 133598]|nr:hypothetical protein PspLS_08464 [Pyricularia sp. CBS 133598]
MFDLDHAVVTSRQASALDASEGSPESPNTQASGDTSSATVPDAEAVCHPLLGPVCRNGRGQRVDVELPGSCSPEGFRWAERGRFCHQFYIWTGVIS